MVEAVIYFLIYVCVLALVIYLVIYVLRDVIGVPIPAKVIQPERVVTLGAMPGNSLSWRKNLPSPCCGHHDEKSCEQGIGAHPTGVLLAIGIR